MSAFLAENLLRFLALVALLAGVAFFSLAETSLFNLRRHQIRSFRASANPVLRSAGLLMERPESTLVTILLGNMILNVLFFAVASVLVLNTARDLAGWQSTLLGFVPLLCIIFFGGVLPKVVAATYPAAVAALVAGPLYAFDRIIWPAREFLQRAVVVPGIRLLSPSEGSARPVGPDELRELLAHSASAGLLAPSESLLLQEVVELGTIKVREVLVPRVDMVSFSLDDTREFFIETVRRTGVRTLPAYQDDPDNVVGVLDARDVLLHPDKPLAELLQPPWFIPETKRLDSLLRDFQSTRREVALVVDEYGGLVGLVTLGDIVREVVGELFETDDLLVDMVLPVEEDTYLLNGRLSVREWAQTFGQRFADFGVNTIGGLITAKLGRVARVGDTVTLRNLRFTVTRMQRNRIVEVRLQRLPAIPAETAEGRS